MRDEKGRFIKGHKKIGGFSKGSIHSEESKRKISKSISGNIGENARAWKGDEAGYVAKHSWIVKHHGNANKCENLSCQYTNPKRFEWANISGDYKRERDDYIQLCPSCHRKMDINGLNFRELCAL